jgi:hypothetical protein
MGGRDQLEAFVRLVARRLTFDVAQLIAKPVAAPSYLASSFMFRAYYGVSGAYDSVHRLLDQAIRTMFSETVSPSERAEQQQRYPGVGLNLSAIPEMSALVPALASLPARAELRTHYQVIPVAQSSDPKKHAVERDDKTGRMHSLGHDNIVGSGALLDALGATRRMRGPSSAPPSPQPPVPKSTRATVRRGSIGEAVVELQRLLNNAVASIPALDVDGIFGRKTDASVGTFQRQSELVVDHIVGDRTWAALDAAAPADPVPVAALSGPAGTGSGANADA